MSRDAARVYAAGSTANGGGTVAVIDASTNTLTTTIDVGSFPGHLETSRDGRYLYVGKIFELKVVDTQTNSVISTVPLPQNPMELLLNADGSRLYVTTQNGNAGAVLALDTASKTVVATIPTKGTPGTMVIDANLGRMYVGEPSWNSVTVINTATNQVSSTTALSGPPMDGSLALDPTGKRLYTKYSGFRLEQRDTFTTVMEQSTALSGPSKIIANLSGRGGGMSVSPSGGNLYVPMSDRNTVTAVPLAPAFADVPAGTKFAAEINWLASRGISTGWEDGNGTATYRPLTPVNRDAMAAFMYRLAGKPAFTAPAVSPFADMAPSTQFYAEITWLADQEISTGWEANGIRTYRPVTPVNRDAMAAFMYRLAGEPAFTPPATSPFMDVDTSNQFYKEITWLADQGISTGWGEGNGQASYRPLTPVNRDAMAAFMYRFDSKHGAK
ncbi:YVTN family beta-propeller protein [Arthrobacter oryzae]|nr:S-layer homology domain-containing protein [Arthrobacter oryzae]MDQ0078976.1 YVTN family beta-propeller protein [Arthrobacter oryzae]